MYKVKDILDAIGEEIRPSLAESWDNSGFIVGNSEDPVTGILMALDISSPIIDEAISVGCNLIISHHPVIFNPIKSVTDQSEGMIAAKLLRHSINAICIHTPLDSVSGGINDILAQKCSLENSKPLERKEETGDGIGRFGCLHMEIEVEDFAEKLKHELKEKAILVYKARNTVKQVAVVGGSGDDYLDLALSIGCDTFVTGDLKHHMIIHAVNLGINVLCAGHYHSEVIGLQKIEDILKNRFQNIQICQSNEERKFYTVL